MEEKINKEAEKYANFYAGNYKLFDSTYDSFVKGAKSQSAKEYWFEQFKELFRSAHECGYCYFDDNHVWEYEQINPETEYGFEDWFNTQKELL